MAYGGGRLDDTWPLDVGLMLLNLFIVLVFNNENGLSRQKTDISKSSELFLKINVIFSSKNLLLFNFHLKFVVPQHLLWPMVQELTIADFCHIRILFPLVCLSVRVWTF